ncbi:MAG TPA: damage-inducible protein CinA [Rhodospirillaceae bacterium]|nr:damage-inducible protein CinA [Rhodospirillaceae bacterium]
MRFTDDIERIAFQVIEAYTKKGKKIVTAESCTGGLIAAALTSISGASAVVDRGFVTYDNNAKIDLLGVLPDRINTFGAVSPEVADDMAMGALDYSHADVALSVTGIAGPNGGTAIKPVGLVYFGIATRDGRNFHVQSNQKGDRHEVRRLSVIEGLKLLLSVVEEE